MTMRTEWTSTREAVKNRSRSNLFLISKITAADNYPDIEWKILWRPASNVFFSVSTLRHTRRVVSALLLHWERHGC